VGVKFTEPVRLAPLLTARGRADSIAQFNREPMRAMSHSPIFRKRDEFFSHDALVSSKRDRRRSELDLRMNCCPDCGKELDAGVSKCADCNAEFVTPVGSESSDPPVKKSDELRQLESEYELVTRGFAAKAPKTYAVMIVVFLIFLAVALLLAANGKQLFPGWPLIWIFGIIATAMLIYYWVVSWRTFGLKRKIAKEKKRLQSAATN
jgi:hypothetical protein